MTTCLTLITIVLLLTICLCFHNLGTDIERDWKLDLLNKAVEKAAAKHEHTSNMEYEKIINTKKMSSYYSCSIFPGYIFESVCNICKCRYIDERILDSNSVRDMKLLKEFKKKGSKNERVRNCKKQCFR